MATLLATATVALAVVFANTTPIAIPTSGSASPYPSPITVSGRTGTISDVNVDLRGLSHTFPDDVAVLLVGPGGQRVVLMSDAGGGDIACGGGGPVSNVNLTFDSQAVNQLPDTAQISSGTYRPIQGTTNADCGNLRPSPFPAPAPSGPYGTTLSVFNGTAPNGTYSLYVVDDTTPDGGSISGGWSLDLLTNAPPPPPNVAPVARANSYSVKEDAILRVPRLRGVLANDSDVNGDRLVARKVTSTRHGTLTLRADGSLVYNSKKNFAGVDTFYYRAFDGKVLSNKAKVSIRVRAVAG